MHQLRRNIKCDCLALATTVNDAFGSSAGILDGVRDAVSSRTRRGQVEIQNKLTISRMYRRSMYLGLPEIR